METKCKLEWKDHIPINILNRECTDKHLYKAAEIIVNWEPIARNLDFREATVVEIQKNYNGDYLEQKYQFLIRWKRKIGSGATYYTLLQCLDECDMRKCAEDIADMIKKGC